MAGRRRNNIADMTISEQVESIKEQICDGYCKYRVKAEEFEDKNKGFDWLISSHCEHCPMGRL